MIKFEILNLRCKININKFSWNLKLLDFKNKKSGKFIVL